MIVNAKMNGHKCQIAAKQKWIQIKDCVILAKTIVKVRGIQRLNLPIIKKENNMKFLTFLVVAAMFLIGVVIGFFLSFYFVFRKRLKAKLKRDQQEKNGIQPGDVDKIYDI
jgi:MFS superfamily sulfate permease-like transporter